MNRITIFASYDKNGIIHDFVISYLKELRKVSNKIIFVADNYITEEEQNKIKSIVDYVKCEPHGEYDFGSYKIGYNYLIQSKLLDKVDEIILCNDSCFCINSLEPVFNKMTQTECDFWGLSANNKIQFHLQSFFLVFNKKVFTSIKFVNFINSVKHHNSVEEVIYNYEISLTQKLIDAGFKYNALIFPFNKDNPTKFPLLMLKMGYPIIKRKFFSEYKIYSKESYFKALLLLIKINKKSLNEILSYFNYSSLFKFWLYLIYSKK